MQILCSMIIQIKKKNCVKDCAEMINLIFQHFKTINLSCCSEQDLSWCHQYKSDFNDYDDSDDFNKSVSNLLNILCRCCWTNEDIHFHFEEVNFFNSHLDAKNYESDDIIDAEKKIYFYDIHLFINFFKNVIHIKTDEVIHHNFNKCLHSIAQNWYIRQLLAIEDNYIWKDQDIECWEKMLFHHFKWIQFNAMKELKTEWYIIQDVKNNQELLSFVLNVICHIKNADMINISAQLIWI